MRLYLDTEFNEFKGGLISMALVKELDDEFHFYEVLPCAHPGPWVSEHVMPVLKSEPVDVNLFKWRLQFFLQCIAEPSEIIADWPDDIRHFCEAMITGPGTAIQTPPLTFVLRRDLNTDGSTVPHNALHDAIALRKMDLQLRAGGAMKES